MVRGKDPIRHHVRREVRHSVMVNQASHTKFRTLPKNAADIDRAAIAALRDRILRGRFKPFEIVLELEIDDAGNRIRAVNRRSAAGDHFDALDQLRRDLVDVDRPVLNARNDAMAVDEHQCPVRPDAAQIDRCDATARIVIGRVRTGHDLRQFVQDRLDIRLPRKMQLLRRDLDDRAARGCIGLRDPRAGDDDLGGVFARLIIVCRRGLREGCARAEKERRAQKRRACNELRADGFRHFCFSSLLLAGVVFRGGPSRTALQPSGMHESVRQKSQSCQYRVSIM